MKELDDFYGRLLTKQQVPEGIRDYAKTMPAMLEQKGKRYCQRCATMIENNWLLPDQSYYCRACILLGRVRSSEELYYFPVKPFPKSKESVLNWQGQLTDYQDQVSKGLLEGVAKGEQLLVHAVTGAGKTEMTYQVIAKVIDQGGQVCLASPRVDVCNELYQRLERDFSCPIVLLHGATEKYHRAPLVIATTHQLLKFYQAFDLLLIDEVDAFPYVDNAMLYHAVDQAVKPKSSRIYMTATSTKYLEQKVARKELNPLHLARRFHGNPLVLPRFIDNPKFGQCFKKGKLDAKFKTLFRKQRQTAYPLLLFFPNIERGQQFQRILSQAFPKEKVGFVSSLTENRSDLVEDFRQGRLTILISTTILERGVTFPCVDVFVMEAQHHLYTSSSLIQIAGRVGRASQRPGGLVYLFHQGISQNMKKAVKDIKTMNARGGFA